MKTENRSLLIEGARVFDINLTEENLVAFDLYLRELLKWNRKINLTSIHSEKEIILKHFLDSLSVVPHLTQVSSLLDMGSGAGFPGIPIKIALPSLEVTLIDSVLKKIDFQSHIIRTLALRGIKAIHGRVQDKEILEQLAGCFDGVIARAFSDLETLMSLGAPFLKSGGVLLAMKGRPPAEELRQLSPSIKTPYRFIKTVNFLLPFSSVKRTLLLFEKV